MISRSFAWINEEIEHSDQDYTRAAALAKKWSELKTQDENHSFQRMADYEEGRYYGPESCEECDACLNDDFDNCECLIAARKHQDEKQAERDLEIELIEDKLEKIGARMMRPYEHWNEDEQYIQYMESDRY